MILTASIYCIGAQLVESIKCSANKWRRNCPVKNTCTVFHKGFIGHLIKKFCKKKHKKRLNDNANEPI